MRQRIKRKFEMWRQEPAEVRLRIASLLTAGSGAIVIALWLLVLLPMQLYLGRPNERIETEGAVSGVRDVSSVSPSVTPVPDVQYFHQTRPTMPAQFPSNSPVATPTETPNL